MSNFYDEIFREMFFKTFGIEKIEYETPGRDWDDDGLASWYVEKDYPALTPDVLVHLIVLLNYLIRVHNDKPIESVLTVEELIDEVTTRLIDYHLKVNEDTKSDMMTKVKEAFEYSEQY